MKKIKTFIKLSIGIVILIYLITRIGFRESISVLSTMNLGILVWVFPLFFIFFLCATLCVKVLVDVYKKIPFWILFKYNLYAWTIGHLLPSKLGELSLAYFLRKEHIKITEGLAVSVVDKLISTIFFILIAGTGMMFLFKPPLNFIIFLGLLIFILGSISIIYFLVRGRFRRFLPNKIKTHFEMLLVNIRFLSREKKKEIFLNFVITCLKWTNTTFIFVLVFLAMGIHVSYFQFLVVYTITSLASLVPISINGLGIRQALGVYLFTQIGIDSVYALNMHLMSIFLNYGLAAIFFVFLMKEDLLKNETTDIFENWKKKKRV